MSTARLIKFGAAFALLAAATHVYPLLTEWRHLERAADLGILTSSSYALLQLGLIVAFSAAAAGLFLRTWFGFFLSTVSFLVVLLCYGYWFSYSSRWLTALSKDPVFQRYPEYIPSHSFGLVGGRWWDLVFLLMTAILLAVVVWILIKQRRAVLGGEMAPLQLPEWLQEFFRRNRRPILATTAGLVFAVIGLSAFWQGWFTTPGPPVFRSDKDIALISPEEGATVRIYQEFRWRVMASASSYVLTISDAESNREVINTTLQQSNYILTDKDAAGMVNGRLYRWSVSARVASDELKSHSRSFTFLRPTALREFRDFNDQSRQGFETEVLEADNDALRRLGGRLERYLANDLDARTPDAAWALQIQGNIFTMLDQRDDALKSYSKANEIWEELGVPEPLLYARSLTNYASISQDVGDLDKSLALYKQALAVLRSREDEAFLIKRSTCLLNLGVLYRELGLVRQAERAYNEALEIDRGLGDLDSVADELTNLGNLIVSEFDDPKRGLLLLQEAVRLQSEAMKRLGRPRTTMADTLDGLAVAYSEIGDQQAALGTWESALEIDRRRGNTSGMLATTNNIANALLDELHDDRGALARYEVALKSISEKPDANPDEVWRTYDGLSRVYQNLGDLQSAERYSLKAITAIDDLRKTVGERRYRRSFNAFRTGPFYGLALLRLRQRDFEKAFAAIEDAKATAFRENLHENSANDTALTVAALRQGLAQEEMALQYMFGTKDDHGLLLVVHQSETLSLELPKRDVLDEQIRQAITSIKEGAKTAEARDAIISLTQTIIPSQLWSKMEAQGVKRLLISPDGLMHNLPFEALARSSERDHLNYIITAYSISIVPSFRLWARMKQHEGLAETAPDLLVIGNPMIGSGGCKNLPPIIEEILVSKAAPELPPLPFSQREVDVVAKYASKGSVSMTGARAQAADFEASHPERFKIIHFATHAISSGSLENSLLLFGCIKHLDALTGPDIGELRLNKQLVVLSACDTDVGDTLFGEGNDSLASGFLMAGAACVIATRWRVRDDVPLSIMETFYDRLSRGDSVDDALRTAKLKYIERDSNPGNWAAFNSLGYGQLKLPITISKGQRARRYVAEHYILTIVIALAMATSIVLVVWRMRNRAATRAEPD